MNPALAASGRRRRQPGHGVVDEHVADVDYGAAALFLHLADDRLGGHVGALQVAVQVPVQILLGDVDERLGPEGASVVDKHVDAVETFERDPDHGLAGFPVSSAAGDDSDPLRMAQLLRRRRQLVGVAAIKDHVRAFVQERAGDVEANAAG